MFDLQEAIKKKMQEGLQEAQEKKERIERMSRGLDVLPSGHKAKCGITLAFRQIFPLICYGAFLAVAWMFYNYSKNYKGLDVCALVFLIFMVGVELWYAVLLLRFIFGIYEVYGGYVLDKIYEEKIDSRYRHTAGPHQGQLKSQYRGEGRKNLPHGNRSGISAGYDKHYRINVNGVVCPANKNAYTFMKMGGYYYVIRVKNLILRDDYYFVRANENVEKESTGTYFPD